MKRLCFIVSLLAFAVIVESAYESPLEVAHDYLLCWREADYRDMYKLLDQESRRQISREEFVDRHRDFAKKFVIEKYLILEVVAPGLCAEVTFRLDLTRIGGTSKSLNGMLGLVRQGGLWRVSLSRSKGLPGSR